MLRLSNTDVLKKFNSLNLNPIRTKQYWVNIKEKCEWEPLNHWRICGGGGALCHNSLFSTLPFSKKRTNLPGD